MILSEEGKYYFDLANKMEYTEQKHDEIKKKLFGEDGYTELFKSYSEKINDITFEFSFYFEYIVIKSILNPKGSLFRRYPLKLSIAFSEDQKEEINVYSIEQFDKILKYLNIEYPATDSMVLTDELKKCIFDDTYSMKLEIKNIPLLTMFNEEKEKREVFGKFSKYIHLYMKAKLDIKDFPEKKFFNEEDFTIKKNAKMKFYYNDKDIRAQLIMKLKKAIRAGLFYCISGPHGIGKTFTLLNFLEHQEKERFHYIYINLDILKKEKNKMEILFYEAKNLFENHQQYISAFEYVKKNLKIPSLLYPMINFLETLKDVILLTVICLIEYIDNEIKNDNSIYAIVIDQFKYINDTDYNSRLILDLKSKIEKNKRFSLIVCSSLNYSGIKNNLILTLTNKVQECKFPFEFLNKLCNKPNIENENEYLYLFGYLPKYCNIQKVINKKYVNLNKKIIKRKFFKFYSKECQQNKLDFKIVDFMALKLKWIIENKKSQLSVDQMSDFIRTNPIKYFTLDLNNLSFDFLFPLIEIIINEIIKSKELKDSIYGLYNEPQKEWYFKHSLFDRITNKNEFLNYYIENTIVIKTLFKKDKIHNFDKKGNTLFCFSLSNVKRYDGVVYIPDEEYALLIQASIYKPKEKLVKYTIENIKEDTKKMEKIFFKPNGISIKKYYLIFILDYEFYYDKIQNMNDILQFSYNYCFYIPKKDEIDYKYIKNFKLKEIGFDTSYQRVEEEKEDKNENSGIFFIKDNYFKKIEEDSIEYKPGYYFAERGMDLITFMEEICSEYNKLINYLYKDIRYYFKYKLKYFSPIYYSIVNKETLVSRIVITLNDKDIFFGISIDIKNTFITNYKWKKYTYEIVFDVEQNIDKNEEKSIKQLTGFFVFEKTNLSI